MADAIDLLSVLNTPRPSGAIVGWRRGEAVSYESFLNRMTAWRGLLKNRSGRSYALYLDDSLELAAALFGAWQAGKTIYLPGDNLPASCAGLKLIVDGYLGEFPAGWQPQSPGTFESCERAQLHRLDPEFVGVVLYTSGTTGAAQAIPKKLRQLAAEVSVLETQFGRLLGDADIASTVAHQHIYGLLFKVLWPIAAGRAIHAESFPFMEGLPAALVRDCVLVSGPAHLKRLQRNSVPDPAVGRLRAIFSSGGPLTKAVAYECEVLLGQAPIEVYGSSETGGIAWRQQSAVSGDAWRSFSGVRWRIDPDDGVIEVSSAYLPDNEWLRTADRAETVADNCFLLGGRVDKIAKVEGKRISLSAIESLLEASPLVTAALAIVVDGERQQVAAFVVPSQSGREWLAEHGRPIFNRCLRNLLVEAIEPVGLPRLWRYPDALPVNAWGKTSFADLSALLDRSQRRPTRPRKRVLEKTPDTAVFELIAQRNLLYFDGHFPGQPILPGVVQLDWVVVCARECFDLPAQFRAIHKLKFHRVIPPETPVRLKLDHDRAKSSVSFQITSELGRHATGRIIFGGADV